MHNVNITIVKMMRGKKAANEKNQRKTIVNSWERCLENNQMLINSGFPTVNCRK